MKTYLETPRLILQEFTPADAHLLNELDSDPEVMKWLTNGRTSTEFESQQMLERILSMYEKYQSRYGVWKAFLKDSGDYIGWFIFRPCKKDPDNLQVIELGYRMKKKFWGQGYGTEGAQAIFEKGFNEFGIETIFATAMKENLASQNIMKKVGMKFEFEYWEEIFPGDDKTAVRLSMPNPRKK